MVITYVEQADILYLKFFPTMIYFDPRLFRHL